jgi:hypothetical protein
MGGARGTYGTAAGVGSLEPPTWSDPGVTRRVSTTATTLARRLEGDPGLQHIRLAGLGELRVDPLPRPDPPGSGTLWYGRGLLVGSGPRLARVTRLDIEVRPATRDTVEVRLVPRSRHIHRWAARRQRRYFRLAHAAADQLKQVLSA